jgi:tRNA (adenine57-N1/adenine58-N1)-methyltransferase
MKIAKNNIERSGLMPYVETCLHDVTKGIPQKQVDAIVLDMATPWSVIPHAWDSLKGSGVFLSFSPTIEQVMKTVSSLNKYPFIEIQTVEIILRNIIVTPEKTRPQTLMIGHSGYLTSSRKILKPIHESSNL